MNLKSLITAFSSLAAALVITASPANAYVHADNPDRIFTYSNGWYNIPMAQAPDRFETVTLCKSIIGQQYKSVGVYIIDGVYTYDTESGYLSCLSPDGYNTLNSIEQECDLWLQDHMQQIVPQGTPVADVPMVCASAVADMMTYDLAALTDINLRRSYQSALPCFRYGTGVCSTYAYAFNAMVSYAPYDAATGQVDYTAGSPEHLCTGFVANSSHAWSAVMYPDGWHYYDVCYFDTSHDPVYLNHAGDLWHDGDHEYAILV